MGFVAGEGLEVNDVSQTQKDQVCAAKYLIERCSSGVCKEISKTQTMKAKKWCSTFLSIYSMARYRGTKESVCVLNQGTGRRGQFEWTLFSKPL